MLPFSEVLDWQRFAVRWPYARASSLVPYLRTISAERVCAMRRAAVAAWVAHFGSADAQVDTLLRVLAKQERARRAREEQEEVDAAR